MYEENLDVIELRILYITLFLLLYTENWAQKR